MHIMGENNHTLMGYCHILVNAGPRVTLEQHQRSIKLIQIVRMQGSSLSNSEMTLVSHHMGSNGFCPTALAILTTKG